MNANMNRVGKFEMRKLINEFDATLIRLYGQNMCDASISRYEAIEACTHYGNPSKAAEVFGMRCGLMLQAA
jgi:hypothetical protein